MYSYLTWLDLLDRSCGDILLTSGDDNVDLLIALFSSTFNRLPESAGDTFPLMEFSGDVFVCGPWNEFVGEMVGWVCVWLTNKELLLAVNGKPVLTVPVRALITVPNRVWFL